MGAMSQAFSDEHQELLNALNELVAAVVEERPWADSDVLVASLKRKFLSHTVDEHRHVYPIVEALIKAHGRATATMTVEHEFIGKAFSQIENATRALRAAPGGEQPALGLELRHLVLQLEAILRLHMEKEERIYVPLLERHLPEAEQHRMLQAMRHA